MLSGQGTHDGGAVLEIAGGIIIAVIAIPAGLYLAGRNETAFLSLKLAGLLVMLAALGFALWVVLAR